MSKDRHRSALLIILATVVLAAISATWIDLPLAVYIKYCTPEIVHLFFSYVTKIGNAWYLFTAVVVTGGVFWLFHSKLQENRWLSLRVMQTSLFVLGSFAVSGVIVQALKFSIGRHRPGVLFRDGLYGISPFSGEQSFPSGHTQSVTAVLLSIALCWPPLRGPAFLLIGLVAISRMVLSAHYFSDVMVSLVLTTLCVVWVQDRLLARGWHIGTPNVRHGVKSCASVI